MRLGLELHARTFSAPFIVVVLAIVLSVMQKDVHLLG